MRYFLEISYKGTNYAGWQLQPNALTVQEVLERELSKILGQKASLMASGRTDTGVHAESNWVQIDIEQSIKDVNNFLYRLNLMLPADIACKQIKKVWPDAHTRFDASLRTYTYRIAKNKQALNVDNYILLHRPINIVSMNKACEILLGKQDFQAFSKVKTEVNNFVCEIRHAQWTEDANAYYFNIQANRFLRGMVRAIVGTLLEVGFNKRRPEYLKSVIDSKDRGFAGNAVPALGLTLEKVEYPEETWDTSFNIVNAQTEDMSTVKELMIEYQKYLGISLCFQGFEEELKSLHKTYLKIFLAKKQEKVCGIVALKKLNNSEAEIKRLYVRGAFRGYGIGEALFLKVINEAKEQGFKVVKLDTLARLKEANYLYLKAGFLETRPYNVNPEEDVKYFEMKF
jgi:tRNA pseudouridine38-40 synthase